jgi:hypothetical protein
MSLALMVAWALAATAFPAESPSGWADSQIIVVEVPESSLSTPTPAASSTPFPSPTRPGLGAPTDSSASHPDLPATGLDAGALAMASALGVAALAVGVLVRRSRRRRA